MTFSTFKVQLLIKLENIVIIFFLIISLEAFTQQKIFATNSNGDLYSFDLKKCSKILIGSTGIGFGDIAFTANDILWGIENGNLYEINTMNATTTLIGSTSIYPVSLVGVSDTLLFAEYQLNLYSINTNNAEINYIGYIGHSANGDLIWDGKTLFMLTPFVKIELNGSLNEILSVTEVSSTIPYSEGSVLYGDNNYTLVCFSGSNVYEVCQLDGSYKLLCSEMNLEGIPGAASTISGLKPINSVNVFTPNADGENDFFQILGEITKVGSVQIINRWGEKIIELSFPFIWDGRLQNGSEAKDGVYFYLINLSEDCVKRNFEQGIITLIR